MSNQVSPCPKCGAPIPWNAASTGLVHRCLADKTAESAAPLQSEPDNIIKLSLPGNYVEHPNLLKSPGDFSYITDDDNNKITAVKMILPGFTNAITILVDGSRGWQISFAADLEKPMLSPSIDCKGVKHWHGYLRNGEFVSC